MIALITGAPVWAGPGVEPKSLASVILAYGVLPQLCAALVLLGAPHRPSHERTTWRLVAAGVSLYGLAGVWLNIHILSHRTLPVPFWTDGIWMLSYACLFVGVALTGREGRGWPPRGVLIDGLLVAFAVMTLAAATVLRGAIEGVGGGFWRAATALAYPIWDLALLGVLAGGFAIKSPRLDRWRWALVAGALLLVSADVGYLHYAATGQFSLRAWYRPLYLAAWLLIALAPWVPARRRPGPATTTREWHRFAPGVVVVIAGAVMLIGDYGHHVRAAIPLAGAALALVLVRTTITFKETQEHAQAVADARLAAIVASSRDAIVGMTLEGEITSWNGAAQRIYGYSESETVGRHVSMLLRDGEVSPIRELLGRVRVGEAASFEATRRRKDGQLIEIATTISPITDPDGRPIGASAIVRDITERKQAEQARAHALHDLEEAQRVAKIGSFTWDPQSQEATWSAQYFEICGRDPASGAPTAEELMAEYMSPGEADRFRVELERQQRDGTDLDGEWQITTETGERRIVHILGRCDPARPGCYVGTVQDVTEQRGVQAQRERALRDLEEAQRIANIGSFTWDPATDSATWSPQLFEIFERDPALGTPGAQDVLSYLHPSERERWLRSVAQREAQIDDDWRITTGTGRERIVHMTGYPDPARHGRFVGTVQDVTEQRRAQEELRRERDFNDTTLDVAGAPIVVMDSEWRLVRFNHQSELLSGYSEPEVLGRHYEFLVPAEERTGVHAHLEAAQFGEIVTQENHLIARSGDRRLIRWSNQVLHDDDGNFTHLIAVGIDITEQRQAELALKAAEERFRRAFDKAPIGMALLSADGVLRDANAAFGVICARELSELAGTALEALLPPADVEQLRRALQELTAGHPVITDLRITPAVGSVLDVTMHGTPLRGRGESTQLLCQFQDVTERKRFETQLQFMADHDPLTGLWNRRRFESELDRHVQAVKRYGPDGALLILDVDNFKAVNDTLGHNIGDQLIVSLASVLRARLRDSDVLARLGGDEFAVLVPKADRDAAGQVADALVTAVSTDTSLLSGEHKQIACSIGVAMFESTNASTERSMIEADLAMYDAKAADGNGYSFYSTAEHLASRTKARLTWMARIERALDDDGFELAAQPILDLRSDGVHQYELLLRMRGDDGELIPPAAFLYVAERFGLIGRIDAWVVGRAIALIARHPHLHLEVNISGRSLGDQQLLAHIDRCLDEHRIDPTHLTFEVTETGAVANITHAQSFAEHLREHGCRFALDDFGAGFGSFYYLKHLPFDYVKIDGEFIQHAAAARVDQLVIEAVVGLAKGLGKKTIAEFVVDEATKQMVKDLAVDYAQGYHIGKPVPVSEAFLRSERQ